MPRGSRPLGALVIQVVRQLHLHSREVAAVGKHARGRKPIQRVGQQVADQAPVGVAFEEVRRYSPRVSGVVALIGLAVVGWNVFQRVSLMHRPAPSDIVSIPESWTLGAVPGQAGVIRVGAPHQAPADQFPGANLVSSMRPF